MSLWRFAVCRYLWKAYRNRLLQKCAVPDEFCKVIDREEQRDWNIHFTPRMSKEHFLRYAGRYIRRLPISQKNILDVTEEEVVYLSKDTRTKTLVEEGCTPAEFVAIFTPHILDRYQHSMRYFGLQAPRSKKQLLEVASLLLGQHPQPKPRREPWAASLWRQFRVDPLIDESGYRMHWVGHRPPVPAP